MSTPEQSTAPAPEQITIDVEQVHIPVDKPADKANTPNARMSLMLQLIDDPDKPVSEIQRIIAAEIASVTGSISCMQESKGYQLKFMTEQIKALRELSKTLTEADVLSKKDILNFDGPKFQFVFNEIVAYFRKALKETGLPEDQINTVLRNFKDIMALKEPELRKNTDRFEGQKR